MTDGYFKIVASNSFERTGEFYFFDSQSINSVMSAWERCAKRARYLDLHRGSHLGKRSNPCHITHWGYPPMRGPWSPTLHIGRPFYANGEEN